MPISGRPPAPNSRKAPKARSTSHTRWEVWSIAAWSSWLAAKSRSSCCLKGVTSVAVTSSTGLGLSYSTFAARTCHQAQPLPPFTATRWMCSTWRPSRSPQRRISSRAGRSSGWMISERGRGTGQFLGSAPTSRHQLGLT